MSNLLNKKVIATALTLSIITFAIPAMTQEDSAPANNDTSFDAPPPPPNFGDDGFAPPPDFDDQCFGQGCGQGFGQGRGMGRRFGMMMRGPGQDGSGSQFAQGQGRGNGKQRKERMEKLISELPAEAQTQCNACHAAIEAQMKAKREQFEAKRQDRLERLNKYLEQQGIDVDSLTDDDLRQIKDSIKKIKMRQSANKDAAISDDTNSKDASDTEKGKKKGILDKIF
ncbi:MAG: hypothetical protein AB7U85_09595 [Alphaproteobacteria bacterium]